MLELSVLDQSPISEGSTGGDALRNTIDLAQLADRLGYKRYWLAEHHGGPMLAGPSPEALIGPIAAQTERIRVGSGGVMLPHYSPFKVAETFSMLSALFPGRIDLALGRASGTDPLTAFALQRDRRQAAPDDFPQQLSELIAYLDDKLPEDHPFAHLSKHLPGRPERPEVWLLGSSSASGAWAEQLGIPYAFADFINPHGGAKADAVGVWALAADTEEEAQRLASSSRMTLRLLRRGQLIPVPPPEKAIAFLEGDAGPRRSGEQRRGIVGTPDMVRERIEEVARDYGAREVIVLTITYDHAARARSYELIAEAFKRG
jgi:alkanesulfonate monooxygenase SsuD/methylene tetrahydromethanopterin reductase-like flavin-dependent oxidoreductase (luciferase family)